MWLQNFDHDCAAEFGVDYQTAVMIKPIGYDSGDRLIKHNKYYNLWSWARKNYNLHVQKLEKKYSVPVEKQMMRTVVLVTDGDKSSEKYYKTFAKVAKMHNFVFSVSDGTNDMHEQAMGDYKFRGAKLPAIRVYSKNSTNDDDNLKVHKYTKSVADLVNDDLVDWLDWVNIATRASQMVYSQPIIRE